MAAKSGKSISVVIPAYNEEGNISAVVQKSLKTLKKVSNDYEVVVVDDGSTDKTGEIIGAIAKANKAVKVFYHGKNKGLGEALKTGYTNARKDFVFYIPADGQISVEELPNFLQQADRADVVIGYHRKRADPLKRKLKSAIYHFLLRMLFGLNFRLTTSSKLYRKKVLDSIRFEASSAFLEPEILFKAKKKGCRFAEVPIEHHPRTAGKSKGDSLTETARTIYDLLRMWLLLRFRIRI